MDGGGLNGCDNAAEKQRPICRRGGKRKRVWKRWEGRGNVFMGRRGDGTWEREREKGKRIRGDERDVEMSSSVRQGDGSWGSREGKREKSLGGEKDVDSSLAG
ncbi:hypothetical protein ACLOJK_020177 [Asimina triloba]